MNPLDLIAPYRDNNSLLLILAPAVQSPAYEEQMNQFNGQEEACRERDLVIGHILFEGESRIGKMMVDEAQARALRGHFGVSDDDFLAVLVLKDGTVTKRYDAPVASKAVFSVLDGTDTPEGKSRDDGDA